MDQNRVPAPVAEYGDVVALDHVGLAVADLDVGVSFYTSVLGLVELHRETNADQEVTEAMLATSTESVKIGTPGAASQTSESDVAGTGSGGQPIPTPLGEPARLQVLAPASANSTIARFIDRAGPGMHHIAYRVDDLAAVTDRLRRRQVTLLYPGGRPGTAGSLINFIHPRDTGGALVELVQPRGLAR